MRFERFSERYGYVKIDDAIQMEWMSNELKNLLWNCIDRFLKTNCCGSDSSKLFYTYAFEYWWKLPLDVLPEHIYIRNQNFRKIYMKNEWNEVYDTLDFIAFFCRECQWKTALHDFTTQVNGVLERERSGYRMIDGLITPITDENEITSIKEAIEENLLDTAKTHIQEALNMLSDREHPDYRNSIKESISAVEAVCRYITNESTLDKALPKLKNKGIIIPDMLEDGMKKIYYFTNGEAGIRHALMDESTNIDFEEAKYMLVVCSAFVNYLKAKQGKADA